MFKEFHVVFVSGRYLLALCVDVGTQATHGTLTSSSLRKHRHSGGNEEIRWKIDGFHVLTADDFKTILQFSFIQTPMGFFKAPPA